MVDYFIVPIDNYKNITGFRVTQVSDLLQELDLMQLSNGVVSDHTLLHLSYKAFKEEPETVKVTNRRECDESDAAGEAREANHNNNRSTHGESNTTETRQHSNDKYHSMPKRYKINTIPDDVMYSTKNRGGV